MTAYPDAISEPRERIRAVSKHLGMSHTNARLILRLYAAGGRHVPRESLMDEIGAMNRSTLKVDIFRIRQAVGEGIVAVQRGSSGLGYYLTVPGLSLVMCALNPP